MKCVNGCITKFAVFGLYQSRYLDKYLNCITVHSYTTVVHGYVTHDYVTYNYVTCNCVTYNYVIGNMVHSWVTIQISI